MEQGDNTSAAWESLELGHDGNITVEEYEYYYVWPVTLWSVLQGLPAAVGLLANTILLVLFATSPRQRTVSNIFLLQRAVADVLSLSMMVVFIALRESRIVKYSPGLCTTLSVVKHVGTEAALVLFILFTMDSYLASRPQHHTLPYRNKVMGLTSAAAWLMAAAVGLAAYFLTYVDDDGGCNVGPFFGMFTHYYLRSVEMFVSVMVPLVVVWVFVSLSLPPTPAMPKGDGHEGPNRRLLLGLASTFTVLHGLYWLVVFLGFVLPFHARPFYIIEAIAFSLPVLNEAINPILVICLTEGLRQKVAGWLPARHSDSLPLQDLISRQLTTNHAEAFRHGAYRHDTHTFGTQTFGTQTFGGLGEALLLYTNIVLALTTATTVMG
ncbi:neuropeptides B/W receptor type 1-like [Eriocheir sinensis]|uniref:neuropeptides B/W receptor type 1-like n=1 Tax=Eriocheir sinensis TaxID=95602 RepID=UPI0021C6BB93|nr:neuropeptides B/W receptor type 1-like [Eriocheir sinensis]